jgi:hypothetical protein
VYLGGLGLRTEEFAVCARKPWPCAGRGLCKPCVVCEWGPLPSGLSGGGLARSRPSPLSCCARRAVSVWRRQARTRSANARVMGRAACSRAAGDKGPGGDSTSAWRATCTVSHAKRARIASAPTTGALTLGWYTKAITRSRAVLAESMRGTTPQSCSICNAAGMSRRTERLDRTVPFGDTAAPRSSLPVACKGACYE